MVLAAVTDAVVVVVEAAFVAVMGFMVAETVFTGRISTFSGVLSLDLKTEYSNYCMISVTPYRYTGQ